MSRKYIWTIETSEYVKTGFMSGHTVTNRTEVAPTGRKVEISDRYKIGYESIIRLIEVIFPDGKADFIDWNRLHVQAVSESTYVVPFGQEDFEATRWK